MSDQNRVSGRDSQWLGAHAAWIGFGVLFGAGLLLLPDPEADSQQYLNMAQGTIGTPQPFAARVLLPMSARLVARLLHRDIETSFVAVAVMAYAALAAVICRLARRLSIDGRLLAFAWLLPMMPFCLAHPYSPDLTSMLWVALILLAVDAELPFVAAALVVPAILTRESSILLGIVLFGVLLIARRIKPAVGVIVAVGFGMWLTARLSAGSDGNIHQMNPLIYLLAKFPANFLANILGIGIWTNSFQWCDAPAFTVGVPEFVNLGKIKALGLCRPDRAAIVQGWLPYISAFGVGAGMLGGLARRIARGWSALPEAVRLSLVYGIVMFVLGPMSGKSVMRTTFYGWPAFLIAGPVLMQSLALPALRRAEIILLAGLYLVSAWAAVPAISGRSMSAGWLPPGGLTTLAFCIGLFANMTAYFIVSRHAGRKGQS